MTQAIGSAAQLTLVEESTWGVTPATPAMKKFAGTIYGESLTASAGELISQEINTNLGTQDVKPGQIQAGGSVGYEIGLNGSGSLFKGVLGAVTTTGPDVNGMYTHVFKRAQILPSYTIEKGFTDIDQYFVFRGARFGSMQLSCEPDGLAQGSVELMAIGVTASGTTLDATPTALQHNPYANYECAILEGGAPARFTNLSFTITNNLKDGRIIGSREASALNAGLREVTGSVSVEFENLTMFNKWLNGTETSLRLTYTNGYYKTEFYFPRVRFNADGVPVIASADGVVLTLNFRALADQTEGSDVVITLVNDEATV